MSSVANQNSSSLSLKIEIAADRNQSASFHKLIGWRKLIAVGAKCDRGVSLRKNRIGALP